MLGRRDGEDEVHAPARRLLRDVHHLLDELSEGEHVVGELYGGVASAGLVLGALKLGEIENLVDETQQRFSAGERGLDERLGELGELAGLHGEGVEADDGVELGSKLVRDVEEERSLHPRHLNRKRLAPLLQHLDELFGTVVKVSADALVDEVTRATYYRAEIILNYGQIDRLPAHITLIPGMLVEEFIRTSDRSPLSYLVKPLTDYFAKAFREG